MKQIVVHTYPPHMIFIDQNNFAHSLSLIKKHLSDNKLFIITNTTVAKLYKETIDNIFCHSEFAKGRTKNLLGSWRSFASLRMTKHNLQATKLHWIIIPNGERYKSLKTCEKIFIQLSKLGASRSSCLLALGGGVVGDITGFVASTYMRGVRYFQMPTTLLAQVDASIGGKTGVDLPTGKNLVGTFYQPQAVFIHTDFLKTLPEREFRCGLAEVVKYALIRDQKFWRFLQDNASRIRQRETQLIKIIISTCCRIKARIVATDEREKGQRMILNLGHTLGHAIERLGRFKKWKHGEAVAMGLIFASTLSYRLGLSKRNLTPEVTNLLRTFRLPTDRPEFSAKQYLRAMKTDKKSNHFVFLKKIGSAIVSENLSSAWSQPQSFRKA